MARSRGTGQIQNCIIFGYHFKQWILIIYPNNKINILLFSLAFHSKWMSIFCTAWSIWINITDRLHCKYLINKIKAFMTAKFHGGNLIVWLYKSKKISGKALKTSRQNCLMYAILGTKFSKSIQLKFPQFINNLTYITHIFLDQLH